MSAYKSLATMKLGIARSYYHGVVHCFCTDTRVNTKKTRLLCFLSSQSFLCLLSTSVFDNHLFAYCFLKPTIIVCFFTALVLVHTRDVTLFGIYHFLLVLVQTMGHVLLLHHAIC